MNMKENIERYTRNFNTLSRKEQSILLKAKVCIAGLGGLGGSVTEMLARIGVGHLTLVDGDRFDSSNLNRQLLSTESLIGKAKADAALERVKQINSDIHVIIYREFMTSENCNEILADSDILVDCLDSIDDRFMIQDAARKASIPLVSGAIAGTSGQVTTIYPDDRGFELIYGKREKNRVNSISAGKNNAGKNSAGKNSVRKGIESEVGNLSFCAMFVASVQASETLKVLLNRGDILRNRLFIADLMSNTFDIIELQC